MQKDKEKINFLIIMAEHFSALADPNQVNFPVSMPALKQLAEGSVIFKNAYCNSPVCGPSRMSFLTGRYVYNCGVYDNGSTLSTSIPTFGHIMTRGGYQTAICGRMHIHGLEPNRGFERRLVTEIGNPLLENPADMPMPFADIPKLKVEDKKEYRQGFANCSIFKYDEYVTSRAVDYLNNITESEDKRPFCLTVGYLAAHPSMNSLPALKSFYDKYLKMNLPITTITKNEYEQLPEHIKRITFSEKIFSEKYQQHEMAMQHARLSYLDLQLGQVLNTLKEKKLDKNTVVIFLADHGDGLGRHGQWQKMYFYEEVQRVPVYVKLPGIVPGCVHDRISLIDILPTLAEMGGCEVPMPVDGKSIIPLLYGEQRREEEQIIFSEYHGYRSVSSAYMIIKDNYKYCHYLREPGELYNLKSDPRENKNLINCPAYKAIRANLEAEIRRHLNIEEKEKEISEYNLQRQTVAEAIASSSIIGKDCLEHIKYYRETHKEPWWDGGAYCAQWEKHLHGNVKKNKR